MKFNSLLIGAILAALAALFLWQQLVATSLGYQLQASQARLREQRDRNSYLRLELARLYAPERLAKDARVRLSMSPPSPERLVFLAGFSSALRPGQGLLVRTD